MGLFGGKEKDEAKDQGGFKHVGDMGHGSAYRTVDREAGVVLYGMKIRTGDTKAMGGGFGLAAVPMEDTNLYFPDDEEE